MKVYFIESIQGDNVYLTATSVSDMEEQVLLYSFKKGYDTNKVYVHCSLVLSRTFSEFDVDYIVSVNNQAHTVSTRRV